MGIEYPELPGWEFTVIEESLGQHRVRAVGPRGVTAESAAVDVDAALADLRRWASQQSKDPTPG